MRRRTLARAGSEWRRDRGRSFFLAERGQRRFERDLQHLVHGVDEVQLHGVAEIFGHLGQIFFVVARQDHFKESGAMRGQQLFF